MPFLPASQFQNCLCKFADPTDELHALHVAPPSNPQEHNSVQLLGRLKPPSPNNTKKHKQ
jgi:hypothetical protein